MTKSKTKDAKPINTKAEIEIIKKTVAISLDVENGDQAQQLAKYAESAKEHYLHHLEPATRKAYKIDNRQFNEFCKSIGADSLPAAPQTVILYIEHMNTKNWKVSTMDRKLASISKIHSLNNHPSPITKKIRAQFVGLQKKLATLARDSENENIRLLAKHRKNRDQAKPIEADALNKQIANIDTTTLKGLRDKTLLLVGFVGAFRRSELASLQYDDIERDTDGYTITLQKSKTNSLGVPEIKYLPFSSNSDLCPVRHLDNYLEVSSIGKGFIFRTIKKGDKIQANKIDGKTVNRVVQLHLGKTYSAHSMRTGFCKTADNNGADIASIKKQTGHKTDAQVLHYIGKPNIKKNNAVTKLGL